MPHRGTSGAVKTIIVIQCLALAMLAFWLGKEYQNNIYLQQYVHNTAWTYLPILAFLATFSVAVGASEAYSRVGAKNLESTPVYPSRNQGILLTGGFDASTTRNNGAALAEKSGETVDWVPPGVSFAKVFEDSRPPTVLKHVEPDENLEPYTPPAYPVIKRLKPAREPVTTEATRPTPRPLNRVGMGPGFALPPPPVIRQISRPSGVPRREDAPKNNLVPEDEDTPRENTKLMKPRPIKKKQTVDQDLANDFSSE